jgi:hypothetical protein
MPAASSACARENARHATSPPGIAGSRKATRKISTWGDLDEKDPKSMARMMKRMGKELGEDVENVDEMIDEAMEEEKGTTSDKEPGG